MRKHLASTWTERSQIIASLYKTYIFTHLRVYFLFVKWQQSGKVSVTQQSTKEYTAFTRKAGNRQHQTGIRVFPCTRGLEFQGYLLPDQHLPTHLTLTASLLQRPLSVPRGEFTVPICQRIFFVRITCFVYLPKNIFDQRSQGLSYSVLLSLIIQCLHFLGHLNIMPLYEHVREMYALMYV